MELAHEGSYGLGPTAQPRGLRLADCDVVSTVGVTRVNDGPGLT